MNPDPFEALGLPARPDLDDEQVRAAWRAIAAATHPDRADGGDLARYTAASAAYAELRTPWGRSRGLRRPARAGGAGWRAGHRPAARCPRRRRPGRFPAAASASGGVGVPGPGPPRPTPPPAAARRDRRGAVPGGAAADSRHCRRPGRYRRADRVVRADRPPGPGTPARAVRKRPVPPAGPRAPGWTGPAPGVSRRSGLGWVGSIPSPPARASRAHRPPPVQVVRPAGRSTWTGGVRRAPLRVADGDGMDPPAVRRGRAPGNAPEMHVHTGQERELEMEQGKPAGKPGKSSG